MRNKILALLGAAVLTAAGSTAALAHHAFNAEFDPNSPILLKGKITRVELINPHAWVHIMVPETNGTLTEWMVEGGTPNTLIRNGLNRNTLVPGTDIIVRGYRSRDKLCVPSAGHMLCKANGRDITFLDGKKVFMGSSGTGAPADGAEKPAR